MTRSQADELIAEATTFLEQDLNISINDVKNKFLRKANCKLKGWLSVSFTEATERPNIDLIAKLKDNNTGKIYSPSLKSVVAEFKSMSAKK
jgi:hypothetical protein